VQSRRTLVLSYADAQATVLLTPRRQDTLNAKGETATVWHHNSAFLLDEGGTVA
jgi:hypothetical protein